MWSGVLLCILRTLVKSYVCSAEVFAFDVQESVETVLANLYETRPLPISNRTDQEQHLQHSITSIKGAFNAALLVLSERDQHMSDLERAASQGRCPAEKVNATAELVSTQALLDLLAETRNTALEYVEKLQREAAALWQDNNALRNTLVTERGAHDVEVQRLEMELEQQRLARRGVVAQFPAELF
jgi:hypothetical protein